MLFVSYGNRQHSVVTGMHEFEFPWAYPNAEFIAWRVWGQHPHNVCFIQSETLLQATVRNYAAFGVDFIIQDTGAAGTEFWTGLNTSDAGIGEAFTDMVVGLGLCYCMMDSVDPDVDQRASICMRPGVLSCSSACGQTGGGCVGV